MKVDRFKVPTCDSSLNASQTVGVSVASIGAPSIAPLIAPLSFDPSLETVLPWISKFL